ncbi:uncharacterized protein LOC110943225 [Helianthus annuus]|uniref:uncharacterized protein LOC110943225 n=1 Tax=Helianthus annuus TaxID=4232 RepID=UPI001652CC0B|nr:uncharacterized protein LOC110943225 [Helianthus annuus]
MANSSNVQVSAFWDNTSFDFDTVDASGRSGGLLSIWDPGIFVKKYFVSNRFFLATFGELKNSGEVITIINVYAPQEKNAKKQVWEDLMALMSSTPGGSWILLGDFNCVREACERRNSRFCDESANDFNSFINNVGLSEYAMMGCRFTYMKDDGYRSDHRPLMLLCSNVFFGKPPFRFFNSWLKEDGLEKVVHSAYVSVPPFYPPDKLLAARFRAIKMAIKPWCAAVVKKNNGLIKELMKKVEDLDIKAETMTVSDVEVKEREVWLKTINEIDDCRMEDLKQRSKLK